MTDLLLQGENEISIFLGEGWFKGRLGFDGGYTNLYGDRLYAIADLYVKKRRKGNALCALTIPGRPVLLLSLSIISMTASSMTPGENMGAEAESF